MRNRKNSNVFYTSYWQLRNSVLFQKAWLRSQSCGRTNDLEGNTSGSLMEPWTNLSCMWDLFKQPHLTGGPGLFQSREKSSTHLSDHSLFSAPGPLEQWETQRQVLITWKGKLGVLILPMRNPYSDHVMVWVTLIRRKSYSKWCGNLGRQGTMGHAGQSRPILLCKPQMTPNLCKTLVPQLAHICS